MKLKSFFGILSPIHIFWVRITRRAQFIGTDSLGNRYYRAHPRPGYKLDRRWVVYKGEPEATNVPPEWHGWLHHQRDEFPSAEGHSHRRSWQKPHVPNLTGTSGAYRPPGHILEGGKRDRATGDYEAWTPPE
ncbi:MAG: NADH:ubiquinone oxidoreductase subunit NDUFA12 [Alphaproteobacteria bacterium]|nr:NADH:ubiquinone oxidoreductase subunit NDUFA12 [Alphaproteobacteria bacterium]